MRPFLRRLAPELAPVPIPVLLVVIAIARHGGMGASPDSLMYLLGARSLTRGQGFLDPAGVHQTLYPPGYSAVLALIDLLTPISVFAAAALVNVLSAAAIAWATGALLRSVPLWVRVVTAALAGAGPALMFINGFIWSEPLAIALIMVALVLQVSDRETRGRWWLPVLVGLVLGVAGLVRTAGTFAGAAMILGYLLRRQWWRSVVAAVPAVALPVGWAVVNLLLSGNAAGDRSKPMDDVAKMVMDAVRVVGGWFAPVRLADPTALSVVLVVLALGLAALSCRDRTGVLTTVYLAGLLLGTVAAKIFTPMDQLDDRLLSPVVPLLAVALVLGWDAVGRRWWATVIAVLLAIGALVNAVEWPSRDDTMVGPASFDCSVLPGGVLMSDSDGLIALRCDRLVEHAPRRIYYDTEIPTGELQALQERGTRECVHVVYTAASPGYWENKAALLSAGLVEVSVAPGLTILDTPACG
ncbi:hypothetical protein [Raineyella sp. LH-20]|uniref:hypothetical protein n=1 Tax=Raineyella sp. LH-20 TaxID=3081204 RepID=UPI002952D34E|nr:hypothetical protein [Raineyella sp. LH-20]WOP19874.1 hypothetical protein R0146_06265 [Raineyella sp. LH-20]